MPVVNAAMSADAKTQPGLGKDRRGGRAGYEQVFGAAEMAAPQFRKAGVRSSVASVMACTG
ncbi:hypothetical protein ACWCQW_28345 [Streptomyces mirabilis]